MGSPDSTEAAVKHNWFENFFTKDISAKVDELKSWIETHGGPAIEDVVKQAVADELKGDSVTATLKDLVQTEIKKYLSDAQTFNTASTPVTTPASVPTFSTPPAGNAGE